MDIGAAPGDFAAICCTKGAQKVFGFEPDPIEAKFMESTAQLNNFNISIIPYYCGTAKSDDFMSIDTLVEKEKLSKVDFIKMDIEGAEADALESAKLTLEKFSPKLSICAYHNLGDAEKIKNVILKYNKNYNIVEKPGVIYASVGK